MTEVINVKSKHDPKRYVYIGRPSLWGNPFSAYFVSSKCGAIKTSDPIGAFRAWLKGKDWQNIEQKRRLMILQKIGELKGKQLGCFCKPRPCHGDVLKELAEKHGK